MSSCARIRLVYIAATHDLLAEQEALKTTLDRLRDVKTITGACIGGSPVSTPVALSQEIAGCDLFIGLVGNADCSLEPNICSRMEYEYDKARDAGVARLIYFDEGKPVTDKAILGFKERISNDVRPASFHSREALFVQCMLDLSRVPPQNPDGRATVTTPPITGQVPAAEKPPELKLFDLDKIIEGFRWLWNRPGYVKYPGVVLLPALIVAGILFSTGTISFKDTIGRPVAKLLEDPPALVGTYSDEFQTEDGKPNKYFWDASPEWSTKKNEFAKEHGALLIKGSKIGLFLTPSTDQLYDFELSLVDIVQSSQTGFSWLLRVVDPKQRTKYYRFALHFPQGKQPASLIATAEPEHRPLTLDPGETLHASEYPVGGKIDLTVSAVDNLFTTTIKFEDPRIGPDQPPPADPIDSIPRHVIFRDQSKPSERYGYGAIGFDGLLGPTKIGSFRLQANSRSAATSTTDKPAAGKNP